MVLFGIFFFDSENFYMQINVGFIFNKRKKKKNKVRKEIKKKEFIKQLLL